MNENEFKLACLKLGIDLTKQQMDQFKLYMNLLIEWNEKMNLTAIVEENEIWEKHFYDSIVPFIQIQFETMCDIGSGAGFPGIPVAIVYPNVKMTLVEPLQKRCRFLNEVKKQLKLNNVEILNVRAEDLAKIKREQYDCVSARAVARLSILLELCTPLLKVDHMMIALKGKNVDEELQVSKKAFTNLKMKLVDKKSVKLDDELTRINLYLKKIDHTPSKYPRAYGQIKKKPLED